MTNATLHKKRSRKRRKGTPHPKQVMEALFNQMLSVRSPAASEEPRKKLRPETPAPKSERLEQLDRLRKQALELPRPERILSAKDHVRRLIRENALYLLYRAEHREGVELSLSRSLWMEESRERRLAEKQAETEGVQLPWRQMLKTAALEEGLVEVLSLLLCLELSPVCMDLFRFCTGGGWFEQDSLTLGQMLRVAYPELCRDEILLRAALGPQGEFAERGFLNLLQRHTNHPDRWITLRESIIRQALGLADLNGIPEEILWRENPEVDFDRVILPEELKEESLRLCATALGNASGMSMLFFGPSGTGKTLLARALATRLGRPLVGISFGAMAANHFCYEDTLPKLFELAAREQAIVFIDELDDIFDEGSEASRTLLIHLEQARAVVIVASNNVEHLDPALERRFTVRYRFRLPKEEARRDLWRVLLPEEAEYSEDDLVDRLAGRFAFSGAQIDNCLRMASGLAVPEEDGRKLLDEALLERCALEQFSSFCSEGLLQNEGFPRRGELFGPARIFEQEVQEDCGWMEAYREYKEEISRYFPGRSGRMPSLLLISGSEEMGRGYAAELAARLGFRMLSGRVSDLLDMRYREMDKLLPFVEYNPYEYFFDRLMDEQTLFLLEDEEEGFLRENGAKWKSEHCRLASAIRFSRALIVFSCRPMDRLSSQGAELVDRIRRLPVTGFEGGHQQICRLRQAGYPVEQEAGWQFLAQANGSLRLAALDALVETRLRGKEQVAPGEITGSLERINGSLGPASGRRLFGRGG